MAFLFKNLPLSVSMPLLMRIGLVISMTAPLLLYILYSWALHQLAGVQKNKKTVARSSTEAEYRSVASSAAEVNWIQNLLSEVHFSSSTIPIIYCDNVGATYLCSNPIFHSHMKHISIDFHFVRDQVAKNELRVAHVHFADQLADSLTKPLSHQTFLRHRYKIGVHCGTPILRGHDNRYT